MKHNLKITLLLISFYLIAQMIGLTLINQEMNVEMVDGEAQPEYGDTSLGPRPEMEGGSTFLYLIIGVGIGTALILIIAKFGKVNLWRFWFLLASFLAMALALGAIIPASAALGIGLLLALFKVFKPNVFIHNATEVLMYSGIAVFFVPLLDLFWASIILVVFSIYDAIAVWKSKHMISLAKFQADSNLFAGLSLPYDKETGEVVTETEEMPDMKGERPEAPPQEGGTFSAILGGGDIAIPMLFTGAVMQWLITQGASKAAALSQSFIVTITSALSLFALFVLSEEKFYPAMPFITGGCFLGLGIVALL